jgi:hypothetical protein
LAFGHIEFNTIALAERFEATTLNGAVMDKNVFPRIAADETITFIVIRSSAKLVGKKSLFFS